MDDERIELTPDSAGPYLKRRGVVPDTADPVARSLGGGVSNHVIEVTWNGECLVAKQPLPNLAVEDDWPADLDRVHNEASAADAYERVIDEVGLDARVPAVEFEDREANVIAIECAPESTTMWKRSLLDGQVDRRVAERVGHVLGAVHDAAAADADLRSEFANKRPFDQLRVDPYHRTVARRHPDVGERIQAEIDRILDQDRTLVHGDYSPKNVLVEETTDGPVPWILDFEVAHWGDPAFDTAFMLNHLFIKSIYNHDQHEAYREAAFAFWEAYDGRVDWDIEAETATELAVLMLARVDGKSPVEYVDEGPIADALRSVSKQALNGNVDSLSSYAALATEEVENL